MKKKITFIFVLVMVFVMLFTFIGCDKNEEKDNTQTGGETPTPEEPVSTVVDNSELIADTIGELFGEEDVHLSLKEMNLTLNFAGEIMSFEGPVELYLRRSDNGYDMSLMLQILTKAEYVDKDTNVAVVEATAVYSETVYVGGYLYSYPREVRQTIVNGVGYESFSAYETTPDVKDDYLLQTAVTDWEKAAALTDSEGGKRLTETREVKKANTLQGVVDYMVSKAEFLKDWGWTTDDKIIEVAKNLLSEAAVLAKSEKEADENGNRVLELNIDAGDTFNEIANTVRDNMTKPLGDFVNALIKKDKAFVTDVINRLFPAEGDCLTINNFVKELEKILGENGIIFSLKSVMNRIQTASGLTTQQIADALNPVLKSVLPEGTSVSINPQEGETLYESLTRSASDMLGIDTILTIISPAATDETTGETIPALAGAGLNAKLTAALYGETDSLTLEYIISNYSIFEPLIMISEYSAESMKADLKFGFDKDDKIASLAAAADIKMPMVLPDDVILPEGMETPVIAIEFNGAVQVTYENNDDKFAVTDWKVEHVTYTLPQALEVHVNYYVNDILSGAGITVGEGTEVKMTSDSLVMIKDGGLVSAADISVGNNNGVCYFYLFELPSDYVDMYVSILCGDTNYIVKLLPPATQG